MSHIPFQMNNVQSEGVFRERLAEQIQTLRDINDLPGLQQKQVVVAFMQKIGHLFLEFFQKNQRVAYGCGESNHDILINAVGYLERYYLAPLENILTTSFLNDEWETVCLERTNIEAFNSMFKDLPGCVLDTAEIEAIMQRKEEIVRKSKIPHGVPRSHWWWFRN